MARRALAVALLGAGALLAARLASSALLVALPGRAFERCARCRQPIRAWSWPALGKGGLFAFHPACLPERARP